jgi:hypothetical protein
MVAIAVSEDILRRLEKLAVTLGRPVESVTAEALQRYVVSTEQLVEDVAEARLQLSRGEGVDIDDLDAALEQRRNTKRK